MLNRGWMILLRAWCEIRVCSVESRHRATRNDQPKSMLYRKLRILAVILLASVAAAPLPSQTRTKKKTTTSAAARRRAAVKKAASAKAKKSKKAPKAHLPF